MIDLLDIGANMCHSLRSFKLSEIGLNSPKRGWFLADHSNYYDIQLELDTEAMTMYMSDWYLNTTHTFNHQAKDRSENKRTLHIVEGERVTILIGCFIGMLNFEGDIAIECTLIADTILIATLEDCNELKAYRRDIKLNKLLNES